MPDFSKFVEVLGAWFKTPWNLLAGFIIAGILFGATTPARLEAIKLGHLVGFNKTQFGFFWAFGICLSSLVWSGLCWLVQRFGTERESRRLQRTIKQLPFNERMILRLFHDRQVQALRLQNGETAVAALVRKKLLHRGAGDWQRSVYTITDRLDNILHETNALENTPPTEPDEYSWMA